MNQVSIWYQKWLSQIDSSKGLTKFHYKNDELTFDGIAEFIDMFIEGKIMYQLKTEKEPEESGLVKVKLDLKSRNWLVHHLIELQ